MDAILCAMVKTMNGGGALSLNKDFNFQDTRQQMWAGN